MNVLAIDIGGSHIKFCTQRHKSVVKIDSGPDMTPQKTIEAIHEASENWSYDHVSMGFPGPVVHGKILQEPHNLGEGWTRFRFEKAFRGKPVRIINDAAMQALGSYEGGRMLFLGLGTGLGSALVVDGVVQAMELAHMLWKKGRTYEDYLGVAGYKRLGRKAWKHHLFKAIENLNDGLESDYVVLGGGNAKKVGDLPKNVRLGSNDNAFKGAFMLWRHKHSSSR